MTPAAPRARSSRLRTLAIDRIAGGGEGVARDDGLVVFVPRTAPGDVVEADVAHDGKARFARGVLRRIVTPSPLRVAPPCPHYEGDRCGGCQLQHLEYDAQREMKGMAVADAFARIARRPIAVPVVHAAPHPWHYRRKLSVAFRREADGGWRMGFRAYDDPAAVFELASCRLAERPVMEALRAVFEAAHHLPDAEQLRVTVRQLDPGIALVLEGEGHWHEASAEQLADAVPDLRAIWWSTIADGRRLVVDRRGNDAPGASFVQVNPAMHHRLQEALLARIAVHAPASVVDAYAGAGETAVALAARGCRVTAIEADPDAAAWAAIRLPAPSRAIAGFVERELAHALPADVLVVNPPRAGLHADVPPHLSAAAGTARALFYVSCDPATLARDVGRLSGWRVAHVECFDMFPQTAHVETLCELVPEAA